MDRGSGKRRLSGAEVADESDEIAGLEGKREIFAEPTRVGFAGQMKIGDAAKGISRVVVERRGHFNHLCAAHSAASRKSCDSLAASVVSVGVSLSSSSAPFGSSGEKGKTQVTRVPAPSGHSTVIVP